MKSHPPCMHVCESIGSVILLSFHAFITPSLSLSSSPSHDLSSLSLPLILFLSLRIPNVALLYTAEQVFSYLLLISYGLELQNQTRGSSIFLSTVQFWTELFHLKIQETHTFIFHCFTPYLHKYQKQNYMYLTSEKCYYKFQRKYNYT